MPVSAILKSLLFGLTVALAIGPIALLIVNYGITRGFTSAARSAFGAGFADMTYAIVAFVAGDLLVARLEAHRALYEIGAACLLVIFGGCMLWSALRARAAIRAASPDASRNELVTTYALTIINPLTIVAFAGFAGQLPLAGSVLRALLLALAVFVGSLAVQLALAATGAQLGHWLREPKVLRSLNVASGLGVAGFGLAGLWPFLVRP
ncbi:MAG TPA: LysE family transporter [Steroidobacteraceae bacterium]|nr:LysE family transporter [Steroidobacteraceae bacterium]